MPTLSPYITVSDEVLSYDHMVNILQKSPHGQPLYNAGAMNVFAGIVRDDGDITALELEHYPVMTEKKLHHIATHAMTQYNLINAAIMHRIGRVELGGIIVLCGAVSAHRHGAIKATSMMMDFLKTDAPFWKRVYHSNNQAGAWVPANDADIASKKQWNNGF